MKKKRLLFFVLTLIFLLAACQPSSFTASTSQTKSGVTLTITNVNFSKIETIVTFIVQVSPEWGLNINMDVPPQALHNNPMLIDETGKQHTFISGTYGLPQPDDETGSVKFENVVTFPPVQGDSISFQTEITISEISISQPVSVSIADRQVLDTWPIGKGITFSRFTDVPGTVKLVSQNADTMELEFTFDRVTSDGLRLGCLSFYPADQANTGDAVGHFRECLLNDKQIISRTGLDMPVGKTSPISFRVTGNAEFIEPFITSWPMVGK